MSMCPGCGNEVRDPKHCPVCEAGRATPRKKQPVVQTGRCACPRCDDFLDQQDWDGTVTLCCPNCRGTFFPDRGLEKVLDKLRATVDPVDVETVMQEFKDRFKRALPEAVRYKKCPVCDTVMLRRNYGTVSGVIVDACADHGTWVDEAQFAALADFICRGGDALASQASKVRARASQRPRTGTSASTGGILDRFLKG